MANKFPAPEAPDAATSPAAPVQDNPFVVEDDRMDTSEDVAQPGRNASAVVVPNPAHLVQPDPSIGTFYVITAGEPVGILTDLSGIDLPNQTDFAMARFTNWYESVGFYTVNYHDGKIRLVRARPPPVQPVPARNVTFVSSAFPTPTSGSLVNPIRLDSPRFGAIGAVAAGISPTPAPRHGGARLLEDGQTSSLTALLPDASNVARRSKAKGKRAATATSLARTTMVKKKRSADGTSAPRKIVVISDSDSDVGGPPHYPKAKVPRTGLPDFRNAITLGNLPVSTNGPGSSSAKDSAASNVRSLDGGKSSQPAASSFPDASNVARRSKAKGKRAATATSLARTTMVKKKRSADGTSAPRKIVVISDSDSDVGGPPHYPKAKVPRTGLPDFRNAITLGNLPVSTNGPGSSSAKDSAASNVRSLDGGKSSQPAASSFPAYPIQLITHVTAAPSAHSPSANVPTSSAFSTSLGVPALSAPSQPAHAPACSSFLPPRAASSPRSGESTQPAADLLPLSDTEIPATAPSTPAPNANPFVPLFSELDGRDEGNWAQLMASSVRYAITPAGRRVAQAVAAPSSPIPGPSGLPPPLTAAAAAAVDTEAAQSVAAPSSPIPGPSGLPPPLTAAAAAAVDTEAAQSVAAPSSPIPGPSGLPPSLTAAAAAAVDTEAASEAADGADEDEYGFSDLDAEYLDEMGRILDSVHYHPPSK
ncbi:hypothetical protein BJ912DRAFT_1070228 [Pholiota molesta]|nr:hypothetical protein BJ912DRAFT_1070228 [Pholiota molesta]